MTNDRRLIEDYLPIQEISAEASREKSVRKGHISTLHLWWARRPLVACRAAVYGALVPASRFAPGNGPDNKKQSLGRANAAKFLRRLCRYPSDSKPEQKADIERAVKEAQRHILTAHADRLTEEIADWRGGKTSKPAWIDEFGFPVPEGGKGSSGENVRVTVEDIEAGRAPRPRVLDMFAGGGAIPLEALRLGCEAYALDLNPVAHIIELCTLVYPQKYGRPDPHARGMAGPKGKDGNPTWGGLANEVRYWGEWVLKKVKAEIGDLYPPIPDPAFKAKRRDITFDRNTGLWVEKGAPRTRKTKAATGAKLFGVAAFEGAESEIPHPQSAIPAGYLMPVAYLWTRTVTCKNPKCRAAVPLVKQTWLCKKDNRYAALKIATPKGKKQVRFEVVEAHSQSRLCFDPEAFSKAGNATCPFCGTVADSGYVKGEGCAGRMGQQMMAIACTHTRKQGKVYLSADDYPKFVPDGDTICKRIEKLCEATGLTVPDEPIVTDAKNSCWTYLYGLQSFGDLFNDRQSLSLLTFCAAIRESAQHVRKVTEHDRLLALATLLGACVSKLSDFSSSLCTFNYTGGRGVKNTFSRQALPMVWDYAETNPFNQAGASWPAVIGDIPAVLDGLVIGPPAQVIRGSATAMPLSEGILDAVITDPPYYDNVPYSNISDFFYVWLKRSVGHLYSEHFASEGTPKKAEAVADATRHGGNRQTAKTAYEQMMKLSLEEARRVLKPDGQLTVVYAHKTTLGWATLVNALRNVGFLVTEAWPLDTEKPGRLRDQDSAALASSIFLVARNREGAETGNFEEAVKPELEQIVRERVGTLWDMGIAGADLVIACVGAGLRAFTRFARVEYANGEEVPAERFLTEVETVVLESILARLSKEVGANGGRYGLAGIDPATRFYVLWRYTYKSAELDAGEAIVFANGTHVELDGPGSHSYGARAMIEKKKGKYRLLDFEDRGEDEKLGLPDPQTGTPAPLIDVLHRMLWLMDNRPRQMGEFLQEARPNLEQVRLVAQALAGPALAGGEMEGVSPTTELSALRRLTSNWQSVTRDYAIEFFGQTP